LLLLALQSTWLKGIGPWGVVPDLALLFVVYSSHHQGSQKGQITGFIAGLGEDFFSLAPLGFHAFTKLTVGLAAGVLHGVLSMDYVLFPIVAGAAATLLRNVIGWILALLFVPAEAMPTFWGRAFFIELGMNAVAAPLLFAILKLLGYAKTGRRR
jgi:rod shape-determining protein MreD